MHSDIVILSDRIKELSHTAGQGALTLDGELAGFSPFSDFYEYGDVVYYAATDGTRYEVGSGEYRQNGSNNELTRFPLRSSNLNSGPYYLNGKSADGATRGQEGYFYPLFLTKSSALAVAGATSAHTHAFSGYPGVTFYMPNNHAAHAQGSAASATGVDYAASGLPVNFPDAGIKEVYVTYPGKYSVFTGYGISGYREPKMSGVAFWGSEQLLNYDSDMLWSDARANLGISQTNPQFAIDIGGDRAYSQIRASGFFGGGSGIYFSGGQALPQDATKTASGGRQLEPFFRNKLDGTTGTDAVFYLSGIVNESICFLPQEKGTIFSGPASGCETAGCSPATPTFRFLTLEDIPDLSSLYVVQSKTMDENPNTLTQNGAIALYQESGIITYDDGFVFLKSANRLGIGTNAPNYALDVMGGNLGVSGDIITSGDIYTAYGSNVHSSGGVFARTDSYFGNDVTISGDLFVKGTTTYIDSTNVTIHDKQLELASLSGNAIHDDVDSLIDDGGILVRSSGNGSADTGDKKWTWKNASNTWAATTSNGENLGITSSGIIFNGGMGTVSGAYLAGSGLTLLNNKLTFAIGNMFKVGAVASGHDGNDGNYITNQIHQADEIGFSGIHGVAVNVSGEPSNLAAGGFVSGITLTVDPSGLSGLLYNEITHSGAAVSGLANTAITAVSGTLKYTIDNGAGYAGWKVKQEDNETLDTIATTEAVLFSGVSGVNVDYVPGTNTLLFDAVALSGNLQYNIDASGAAVSGFALNYTNASGNFLRDALNASGMNISGMFNHTVNNLTLSNITAATVITSAEGIGSNNNETTFPTSAAVKSYADSVSSSSPSYAGWRIHEADTTATYDTIGSNEVVLFSGVSGVQVDYIASANTLLFDAVAISGNLQHTIDASGAAVSGYALYYTNASGNYLRDQIQLSGVAVSGFALNYTDASGNFLLNSINASGAAVSGLANTAITAVSGTLKYRMDQITPSTAGSGLIKVPLTDGSEVINMNVDGSGQISHLLFKDDKIRIGQNAAAGTFDYNLGSGAIAIGDRAGLYSTLSHHTVFLGSGAGVSSSGNNYNILIGNSAGASSSGNHFVTAIGHRAARYTNLVTQSTNFIGREAGGWASGCDNSNIIGMFAGYKIQNVDNANLIGNRAGYEAASMSGFNCIGLLAGADAIGGTDSNLIGTNAGSGTYASGNLDGFYSSNMIGNDAGKGAVCQPGSGYVNFIGHKAGAHSWRSDFCDFIGYEAGYAASSGQDALDASTWSAGATEVIAIGKKAFRESARITQLIAIGSSAGRQIPSGSNGNILIGKGAGAYVSGYLHENNVYVGTNAASGITWGEYNVGLGYKAMENSIQKANGMSSLGQNVAIGYEPMVDSSGVGMSVAIGYKAMHGASGYLNSSNYITKNVAIGYHAAKDAEPLDENVFLGSHAGQGSVKTSYEVSIGRFAGYETDHEHGTARSYNVNIGDHAGYHSKTLKQNVNLGHWAGADSSGWNSYNNVAIGPYSMSASSGDLNAVAIGYYAGKEHNGAQGNDGYGNIQIGYKAGYQGRGGHNILLGSDAGKDQYLSNAIVIKHNSNSSNSNWINATAPEDSTLSLGTSIFSAYENANTQIGKEPSSVSDFSSYILRVATHSDSKVVLKTTRNGSSHTAGDQIQSSLDSSDKANTIVNAYGFLQIPIATSSTGTGATRRLFLADGTAIEEIEGTVVVWKGGTEYRLAIYVGSSWRKLANNLSAW